MTQFLTTTESFEPKKNTIFTHFMTSKGWAITKMSPIDFEKIVFIGTCEKDGDMFAAYICSFIEIFKGIKGDEFNNQ